MKTKLELIAGDASERKFYREYKDSGEVFGIRMEFPKLENGYGDDLTNWLRMQSALNEMHIPVPEVYKVDKGVIWTEDLGNKCLSSKITTDILDFKRPECIEAIHYYKEALKLIVQSQYSPLQANNPAADKAFDFEKLHYEMIFFLNHFLNGLLGLAMTEKNNPDFYEDINKLCAKIAQYEHVFCHRDYHVRNIMLKENKIYWIDFQDARMGPHSYDVVSLLRDSYTDITWETRLILFEFYLNELNEKRKTLNLKIINEDDFYHETLFVGLQRNLKAIGSFAYLSTQRKKNGYLKYIIPTLNTICSMEALIYKKTGLNLIAEFPHLFKIILALQSGELTDKLEHKIATMTMLIDPDKFTHI